MDRIRQMEVFVQVVDSGSFTRAAEVLGLPRSTLSTVLQALENRLGAQLLHRTTRRLRPTNDGLRFLANLREGQKTGLFLDHREHRRAVGALAGGARVLDLFAYAGGFTVHALAGGAREAWSVDVAAPALRDAERNVALNALPVPG